MKNFKLRKVLALALVFMLILNTVTPFIGQPEYSVKAEEQGVSYGTISGGYYISGTTMYVSNNTSVQLYIPDTDVDTVSYVEILSGGQTEKIFNDGSGFYTISNLLSLSEGTLFNVEFDDNSNSGTCTCRLVDCISAFLNVYSVELDDNGPDLKDISIPSADVINGIPIVSSSNGNIIELPVEEDTEIVSCSAQVLDSSNGSCSVYYNNGLYLDISNLTDTLHTVNVSAEDSLGLVSSRDYTFVKNHSFPEVSLSADTSVVVTKGEKSYIGDGGLDVFISGLDNPAIKSAYLVCTNDEGSSNIEFNSNVAKINLSGTYSLVVTDYNDVSNTYSLNSLIPEIKSEIVVDGSAPTVSFTVNGDDYNNIKDTWLLEDALVELDIQDSLGISTYSISINDIEVKTETVNTEAISDSYDVFDFIVNNGESSNGNYLVKISSTDLLGNVKSTSFTLKIDAYNPIIESISLSNSPITVDGVAYVNNSMVVGSDYSISDASGVQSIEIYKDGVLSGVVPYTVNSDGDYTVKVTDNAGRVTEVNIGQLWGDSTLSSIKIDSDSPTIVRVAGFDKGVLLEDKLWYSSEELLKYNINDSNITSIKVSVNGVDTNFSVDGNTYSLQMPNIQGEVTISVSVTDVVNTCVTDTFTYNLDSINPTISDIDLGDEVYNKVEGKLYFSTSPKVAIAASDNGSGIKEYKMYLNGEYKESNSNGEFNLSTGEYSFEVIDFMGNSSGLITLEDLLIEDTNKVVIDTLPPSIICNRPSGDVNSWFGDDISYSGDISDVDGLYKVSLLINNKLVSEYYSNGDFVTDTTISGSTENIQPEDNGMYSVLIQAIDNAGNLSTWSDVIFIDREAPEVKEISFSGDGYLEGKYKNSNGDYGFYFKGDVVCNVNVSDGEVSSGIDCVNVTLTPYEGDVINKVLDASSGFISFTIPTNFKGYIALSVVDNVGNDSGVVNPDGIITEESSSIGISLNLPSTIYTDSNGLPLYNSGFSAEAIIDSSFSGVRKIEWGIGETSKGVVNIDNMGNITGDTGSVTGKDKNIVISLDKVISISENCNNISLWVKVTDRAGYSSVVSKKFSIDETSPIISVSYDTQVSNDGFYNGSKVANVKVTDSNFNPNSFSITGNSGSLGAWVKDGDVWSNSISFTNDADYSFSLSCKDYANNTSNTYSSPSFTIDKTSPNVSVTWNNDSPANGNYYSSSRIATITVTEHNFNSNNIIVSGGTISGWTSNGDTHTTTVSFDSDGEYELSISGTDNAGNALNNYSSGSFIVDLSLPTVEIIGVEDGVSYKKDAFLNVVIGDDAIDTYKTSITLSGKRRGDISLDGVLSSKGGTLSIEEFPYEEEYDDIYTLDIKVYDKAGNYVEKSITFSINRNGSSYEFMTSDVLGNYLNGAESISLKEYNVDKIDTSKSKVVIYLNGSEIEVPKSAISIKELSSEDGKYVYQYSIDASVFSVDGKYLVQIYSTSSDGTEYSSITEEYAFVLDTVAPEVIISGVKDNGKYNEYSKIVTIDIRDTTGVKDIKVFLDGDVLSTSYDNGIYSVEIPEDSNKRDLLVVVTDFAGNESSKEIKGILVTADTWLYLTNQFWFKALLVAATLVFIFIITLVVLVRRRKRLELNEQLSAELGEIYSSSGSGSTDE